MLKAQFRMAPSVSVIVVSYNTCAVLKNCLQSIYSTQDNEYETIVVDNCSSDGSVLMVKSEFPGVLLIENSENFGFAKANNLGIEQASGEYFLLLNSDTIVKDGAIDTMKRFLETHREAGATACRLLYANGSVQASMGSQSGPGLIRQILRLTGISRLVRDGQTRRILRKYLGFAMGGTFRSYLEPYVATTEVEAESLSGACLMLRRTAVEEVGLLDENFFMYLEDLDYCLRLRKAGWKLFYLPTGEVVHLVGQSSGGRMRSYSTHAYESLFYFYHKHYSTWAYYVIRASVFCTVSFRLLWNGVASIFSDSHTYTQNRSDLARLVMVSVGRQKSLAPPKVPRLLSSNQYSRRVNKPETTERTRR